MGEQYEYEVWRRGEIIAGGRGSATAVVNGAAHDSLSYGQDGPIEIRYYARRRAVTEDELMEQK